MSKQTKYECITHQEASATEWSKAFQRVSHALLFSDFEIFGFEE